MACGLLGTTATSAGFPRTEAAPVALRDSTSSDGSNLGFTREIWRLSGRVRSSTGEFFDYAVSFFRFGSARESVIYPAAFSLVDEAHRRLVQERRSERGALGFAGAASARLDVRVGNWSLSESSPASPAREFELNVRTPEASLQLRSIARKPRIALSTTEGPDFAYTSLGSTGTLVLDDTRFSVTGKSWLDHEFSNDAAPPAGWHLGRYQVQLDDGREILVETSGFGIPQVTPRRAYLIRRDGSVETLANTQYEFGNDGGTTWRSTHSRAHYPDLWALHVDDQTEYLSLEPVMIDQESVSHGTGASYWDGAVEVWDVTQWSQGLRLGSGYVLLAGYDTADAR